MNIYVLVVLIDPSGVWGNQYYTDKNAAVLAADGINMTYHKEVVRVQELSKVEYRPSTIHPSNY